MLRQPGWSALHCVVQLSPELMVASPELGPSWHGLDEVASDYDGGLRQFSDQPCSLFGLKGVGDQGVWVFHGFPVTVSLQPLASAFCTDLTWQGFGSHVKVVLRLTDEMRSHENTQERKV